jgi:hypothetical protein
MNPPEPCRYTEAELRELWKCCRGQQDEIVIMSELSLLPRREVLELIEHFEATDRTGWKRPERPVRRSKL